MALVQKVPHKRHIRHQLPARLLTWFGQNKRTLPWRENRTPYRVWLAEVMLQQTTVATAIPYFENFVQRWPQVEDLAQASLDDVLNMWQGLGYYNRARNMHRCAEIVAHDNAGAFPQTAEELQKLPGIGPYTSAAIACIAFDTPAPVVDGNIERVLSRVFAINIPLPQSKNDIKFYAQQLTPAQQSGQYAEAMMDLGATICTPQSPKCHACPLSDLCQARALGKENILPRKEKKKPRPEKNGTVYALFAPDGTILIQKRAAKGLLGGLWELPHIGWEQSNFPPIDLPQMEENAGEHAGENLGQVRHVFTHFGLTLEVRRVHLIRKTPLKTGVWISPAALDAYAFSTLMRKVLQVALAHHHTKLPHGATT